MHSRVLRLFHVIKALPPDWDGRTPPGFSNSGMIPVVMTMQPTDGMPCNTYFYDPMVNVRFSFVWFGGGGGDAGPAPRVKPAKLPLACRYVYLLSSPAKNGVSALALSGLYVLFSFSAKVRRIVLLSCFGQVPGREGEKRKAFLREFGLRNRSSSGELLAGFFRYFSSEFDCRMNVVRAFVNVILLSQGFLSFFDRPFMANTYIMVFPCTWSWTNFKGLCLSIETPAV